MKKAKKAVTLALCVVICLAIAVFAAGCKSEKAGGHDVDIAYFTEIGTMPESEFKIGDGVPEIAEDSEEYFVGEADGRGYFSNGEFFYYYDKSEEQPVITAIAAFGTAFGFETGAVSIEVTKALDSQEVEYTLRAPEKGEVFFLPASDNREVAVCDTPEHKITFVFEDNALCAVYMA